MAILYALFDFELNQKNGGSIDKFVSKCEKLDAKVIQYRDKLNSLDKKQEILTKLRQKWQGVLIINDELELAPIADGLHLGQDDILNISKNKRDAVNKIRQKIGNKWIGLSTHNIHEIEESNSLDVDYIGLGAYRDTSTKSDIVGVLGKEVEKLSAISTHDVAVIGGVKVSDNIDFAKYKVVGSDIYLCD